MNRISQGYSLKKAVLTGLPWMVLLLLALWLRLGALEERTVHADEAVQGMITADLLETGDYVYNPQQFHGPSLYYLTLPVAWLRGQETRDALDIVTLRLVPLVFGLGLVLSPLLFRKEMGSVGTYVAGTFLALSPGLTYFSTFYIQEMLLVAGFILLAGSYWRYRQGPGTGWAVLAGLAAGLMAASKESAILYVAVILLSGWISLRGQKKAPDGNSHKASFPLQDALIFLGSAALVAIPLYSSFGSNPHGLIDAVTGLYQYEPEPGHEKPWQYYLSLISGAERGRIFLRGEGALMALALLSTVFLFVRHRKARLPWYFLLAGGLLLILFSAFPYKTPWLMLGILPLMALLSGWAVQTAIRDGNYRWPVLLGGGAILFITWCLSLNEALWTTRTFPVETRNPYAYVHTSWDLLELSDKVIELTAEAPDTVIKVIADEYWPIPWYLRSLKQTGYWSAMPENPYAPVMIVSAELAGELEPDIMKDYNYAFRGLRPGKIMLLYWTKE